MVYACSDVMNLLRGKSRGRRFVPSRDREVAVMTVLRGVTHRAPLEVPDKYHNMVWEGYCETCEDPTGLGVILH